MWRCLSPASQCDQNCRGLSPTIAFPIPIPIAIPVALPCLACRFDLPWLLELLPFELLPLPLLPQFPLELPVVWEEELVLLVLDELPPELVLPDPELLFPVPPVLVGPALLEPVAVPPPALAPVPSLFPALALPDAG